jgi:hypothetical protein
MKNRDATINTIVDNDIVIYEIYLYEKGKLHNIEETIDHNEALKLVKDWKGDKDNVS